MLHVRILASCVLGLVLIGYSKPVHAVFRIWDPVGFSFDWHTAANWDPDGVPSTIDLVQISGSGLTTLSADTAAVNSLVMTGGAFLSNGHTLNVDNSGSGVLTIDGVNSTPAMTISPAGDVSNELRADQVNVIEGVLTLSNENVVAEIDTAMTIGGNGTFRTSGPGMKTARFDTAGGVVLTNNGMITAGGGTTRLVGNGPSSVFDLDGNSPSDGVGEINVSSGATLISEGFLVEPFNGAFNVGGGGDMAVLEMMPSATWTIGTTGVVSLDNGELRGTTLMNEGFVRGHGLISAPISNKNQITAVDGTLNIFVRSETDLDGTSNDGELVASTGDLELSGGGNFIPFAGDIRVSAGQQFRVPATGFVVESGGFVELSGGSMAGGEFTFRPGSLIRVGCCVGDARLQDTSVAVELDSSRLEGEVALFDDLTLEGIWIADVTSSFSGDGALIIGTAGSFITTDGLTIAPNVINEGFLRISTTPVTGELRIDEGFSQTEAGDLLIDIKNVLPGDFDVLSVGGNVALDGSLQVSLINDFEPVLGNTFTILTSQFGSISGVFDEEDFPSFNGLTFDIQYNPQSVVLEVVAAPIFTADFDLDGDVDDDDLAQWKGDFGVNDDSDADGDGDSDGADFLAWQRQLGSGLGAIATPQAVPEPGGRLLLILILALVASTAGRSRFFFDGQARARVF